MIIPSHHPSTHDVARRSAKPPILIIDDSNVVRSIVRSIFQNDFEVHEASDGTRAIEMLRMGAYNYSAIILDLVMQEVDGWEVLKFLRESGIVNMVPVVVETASAIDLQTVTELYECGAWEVIGKPFDGKVLLALVKSVCERASAAAAAIASVGGELNAVLEGTAAAVFAVDAATGKIVRANGHFNALVGCPQTVGFTLAEVVGQNAGLFNGVVKNAVDSGSGGPILVDSLKPDRVDVLFCELMKSSGARHDMVVGTLMDITAMAKRLRELEAAVAAGRRA
ncbi:MAG: response regulator [Kiritimatiellae bacterium]|nr:response regulator [Kiritimatiellia bacterium]